MSLPHQLAHYQQFLLATSDINKKCRLNIKNFNEPPGSCVVQESHLSARKTNKKNFHCSCKGVETKIMLIEIEDMHHQ
jgi:hypothetical protein